MAFGWYGGGWGGRGYRWMFYLTGRPGWLRFGFSPGWLGRSPTGLPPTATYLMQTGQLPRFVSWMKEQWKQPPTTTAAPTKEQEISMLESEAKFLEEQLQQIRKRLDELKRE
ncbi:MAG: DUF5320 domain-containing protein [Candidatus Methanospirare jalkutatii]|nr:MAG: DUF5320 domain-containing protein [Candidatus Methanospirare jalkutatii]UYZ40159.1 MAG: DUF5320 domain-containing protein [Candidatus Methanospirare jalkutatii]